PGRDAHLSFTVPGAVDAYLTLLETRGTKTVSEVLAPALHYAERGFPMYEYMNRMLSIAESRSQFDLYPPGGTAVFYPNGRVPAALIRMDRAASEAPAAGDPHRGGAFASAPPRARSTESADAAADGTTHIAALDRDGNMICLTPSGGVFRKSAFVPEIGCTLSTRSEMFVLEDDHPNGLVPGKRPRTTLVSYLICEGGVPTMTIGCPGGDDQSQADLQLVLNLLVFGMNPQQAVEVPRFSTQTLVNSFYPRVYRPNQLNVAPAIHEPARAELGALGHEVTETGACGIGA